MLRIIPLIGIPKHSNEESDYLDRNVNDNVLADRNHDNEICNDFVIRHSNEEIIISVDISSVSDSMFWGTRGTY